MKKIALTGVIGSGKTTAANYFKDFGVPVFIADDCAKDLMLNNNELRSKLISLLGDKTYNDGKLNKEFISDQIFKNKNILNSVNNLIHPMVQNTFNRWFREQNFKYVVYEAALIFENNSEHLFDKIIYLYIWVLIINALISWLVAFNVLNTSNRFVYSVLEVSYRLTAPPLNFIRKFLPNLGPIDISPVILILALMFIRNFVFEMFGLL